MGRSGEDRSQNSEAGIAADYHMIGPAILDRITEFTELFYSGTGWHWLATVKIESQERQTDNGTK